MYWSELVRKVLDQPPKHKYDLLQKIKDSVLNEEHIIKTCPVAFQGIMRVLGATSRTLCRRLIPPQSENDENVNNKGYCPIPLVTLLVAPDDVANGYGFYCDFSIVLQV